MRLLGRLVGVLVVAALSAVTHAFAGLTFVALTCGAIGETGDRFPAEASPQGRVCASDAETLFHSPGIVLLLVSAVLTVVLVVLLWRRLDSPWRWLTPLLVLVVPVNLLFVLGLPPDECSAATKRDRPAYDCITVTDG
jgi:hypothetical protein